MDEPPACHAARAACLDKPMGLMTISRNRRNIPADSFIETFKIQILVRPSNNLSQIIRVQEIHVTFEGYYTIPHQALADRDTEVTLGHPCVFDLVLNPGQPPPTV